MAIVKSEYNVLNPASSEYDTHYLKTSIDQVDGLESNLSNKQSAIEALNSKMAGTVDSGLKTKITALESQMAGTTDSELKRQIANKANSADVYAKSAVDTALGAKVDILANIAWHNTYPRCKYLGSAITTAQNNAIKNRTYEDLFIGDYWTINGVNYRIAAIEYYTRCGDSDYNRGHIVVVPDSNLYSAQMNTTNTTSGGYAGSAMRTSNLANAKTAATNAFGSHVSSHRILICNAVDSSGPSGWAWYDSSGVELMNEVQVYGTRVWGSALKGFDVGTQKFQFPLFAAAPQYVNTRQDYWLQDVSSNSVSSDFAVVYGNGIASGGSASASLGVRPAITLSYI